MTSVTYNRTRSSDASVFRPEQTAPIGVRLKSIDALRGLVMIIMLLDHLRETWLLYLPVGDPVDAKTMMPSLFFTRLTSTLCAPIFVALTGVSAFLYSRKRTLSETSLFLLKRGAFLVILEMTLVNFAWRAEVIPQFMFLQVIWAIGLCMIALAALIHLSRRAILITGLVIVGSHNLLDFIQLTPDSLFYIPWSILHQRSMIDVLGIKVRFSYPLLPWIGVICLGWSIGPWFSQLTFDKRQQYLIRSGTVMLTGFLILRALNVYGDAPWFCVAGDTLRTVMSFLALTKYPPSLLYLLFTLGIGSILLAQLERLEDKRIAYWLAILGGAPMFFYLLHLYTLRVLYIVAFAIWGPNHGDVLGLTLGQVWVLYAALIIFLYFPTCWFSNLKKKRKDIWWLKYL